MSKPRSMAARTPGLPRSGSAFEVYAVCTRATARRGEESLRAVGTAVVQPDRTITAWLDAHPVSGLLVLRPCPDVGDLRVDAADEEGLSAMSPAGCA